MMWILCLVVFIGYIIWENYIKRHPYDSIPGPLRLPLVGNLFMFLGYSTEQLYQIFQDMHIKYGKRCMTKTMGTWTLHTCDVKDIEIILTNSKNTTKAKAYEIIKTVMGDGLVFSTGNKWHTRRKILTPSFHFDILKNCMRSFQLCSTNLIKEIKTHIQSSSEAVDLFSLFSDFTLQAACENVMGLESDLENFSYASFKNSFIELGPILIKRIMRFWLHSDFIFNNLPLGATFRKLRDNNNNFTREVIAEKKRQLEENPQAGSKMGRLTFMDLLIEAEKRGEIDSEGIREEAYTFINAEKLYEEIKCVLGESDRPLSTSELANMKYLDAVCKESLRMYPSIPMVGRLIEEDFMLGFSIIDLYIGRGVVLPPVIDGMINHLPFLRIHTIDDKTLIKKGTEVMVRIFNVHRLPELFPEPEVFKPERFLDGNQIHPFAFIPFSAGLRNCVGQKFAKLEMKCFICEIIRNFKIQPLDKGARPALSFDLVLRSVEPIRVKFNLR